MQNVQSVTDFRCKLLLFFKNTWTLKSISLDSKQFRGSIIKQVTLDSNLIVSCYFWNSFFKSLIFRLSKIWKDTQVTSNIIVGPSTFKNRNLVPSCFEYKKLVKQVFIIHFVLATCDFYHSICQLFCAQGKAFGNHIISLKNVHHDT